MERVHVAILVVIIIYSNITIYALKMYKERARLENSHYQKASLKQFIVAIIMSVGQSGGCRP